MPTTSPGRCGTPGEAIQLNGVNKHYLTASGPPPVLVLALSIGPWELASRTGLVNR